MKILLNFFNRIRLNSKKFSLTLTIILITFILIFFGLITYTLLDVRLEELNNNMKLVSKVQEGNKSLHMLVKYTLLRNRAIKQSEDTNDYLSEASAELALPEVYEEKEVKEEKVTLIKKISLSTLEILNTIMGIKSKIVSGVSPYDPILQNAYVKERNHKYDDAIELYNKYQDNQKTSSDDSKTFISLHIAFCKAQLGFFEEALTLLTSINNMSVDDDTKYVVKQLVSIITELKNGQQIAESLDDQYERGRSFYFLARYDRSKSELQAYVDTGGKSKDGAMFYLARSFEETGDIDKASKLYEQILKEFPNSPYIRNLMQRIVLQANIYNNKNQVIQDTVSNLKNQGSDEEKKFLNTMLDFRSKMNAGFDASNKKASDKLISSNTPSKSTSTPIKQTISPLASVNLESKKATVSENKETPKIELIKPVVEKTPEKEVIQKVKENVEVEKPKVEPDKPKVEAEKPKETPKPVPKAVEQPIVREPAPVKAENDYGKVNLKGDGGYRTNFRTPSSVGSNDKINKDILKPPTPAPKRIDNGIQRKNEEPIAEKKSSPKEETYTEIEKPSVDGFKVTEIDGVEFFGPPDKEDKNE